MGGPLQQSASAGPHISSHGADTGDAVMARWLQSAGLQHLAAPLAAAALDHRLLPSLLMQDYARYGVQSLEDKQKLFRLIKTISSGAEPVTEPATPPPLLRPVNRSGMDFLSPEFRGDFGSGILDLHSIDDSELFSEVSIPEPFHSSPSFVPVIEKGFENDFESSFNIGKPLNKPKFNPESSPLRSNTLERDRGGRDNTVARIKVVVRKRPINKKEIARKEEDIVSIEDNTTVAVHEPKLKVDLTAYVEKHEFVFDAVLDEHVCNDEVYNVTVEPIVPAIFQRTKATCFAYGQTGSGKTYTMQPLPLRASQDILGLMQQPTHKYEGFQLWLSFFEIYGGKLYDLLNERRKLCMREDGRQQVCIVGLKEYRVSDVQLVREYIDKGNASRSTGSTGANEESSRSHAILQLVIKKSADGSDAKAAARPQGKLSFIDLAGSERGADTTDNDRQTRMEGAEINKSLLALKECIRALDNDQGHIPFRGSKLTEVLRDSFVGDSRTVMISCISPNAGSCEHTLNTLRYADRVKGLSKSGNPKRETITTIPVSAPTSQRETNSPPPPAPTIPPSQQVQELLPDTRVAEKFMWHNQLAEREGISVSEYGFAGRDENRTNSSFSGREESRLNSSFSARDENRLNSSISGRDENRLTSSFSGRDESRISSSFPGRDEGRMPSGYAGREDGRMPFGLQGRDDGRMGSGLQGRDDSRMPLGSQGRDDSRMPPGSQGRDDGRMSTGSQGRDDSRMPSGSQGRDDGRLPSGSQGRDDGRVPSGSQGRDDGGKMPSGYQGRDDSRMSSGFSGREDGRMPSSYQGKEDNRMSSGFPGREENRMSSGYPGREEGRMAAGYQGREESRMAAGYQGREESRMPTGYPGREDSRMPGYSGREDSRIPGYPGREDSRIPAGYAGREDNRIPAGYPGREDSRIPAGYPGREDGRMPLVTSEKDRMIFRDNVETGSGNHTRDLLAPGGNENQEQERHQLILPSRRKGSREDKSDRNPGHVKEELSRVDSMNGYQRRNNIKEEVNMNAAQYLMKETDNELESVQTGYDGHINAILEEEEEVISAHRKEVEDTMEIVREEMKLLAEVDRPGSRIDRYVSQLNYVLSRKAAGIVNLQARLTRFQRHLKEQEILSRTTGLRQP